MNETLTAGRELDALVAEKVMGWRDMTRYDFDIVVGTHPGSGLRRNVPAYSTDIDDAWDVVEHAQLLAARGKSLDEGFALQQNAAGKWEIKYRHGIAIACEDTAPLVICRAALAIAGSSS